MASGSSTISSILVVAVAAGGSTLPDPLMFGSDKRFALCAQL